MAPERDLFANFDRMRREMDELLGNVLERTRLAGRGGGFSPAVDVYYVDSPPRAIVEAELAGVDPDAVSLEIRGRELVIGGHRRVQQAEGRLYQQIEVEHGPFRRVISLGADVRGEDARAVFDEGILRVEIPLVQGEKRTRSVPIEVPREDRP
jgi:HSP20 family protein